MRQKRNIWDSFILALFFLLGCIPKSDALVLQVERTEMIQESQLIVIGTVLDKKTRWNEGHKFIMTDYTFSVDQVLYGKTENPFILSFAGGRIGEEAMGIYDVPTFEMGEIALLFVVSTEKNVMSSLAGSFQGKFTIASPIIDTDGHSIRHVIDGYGNTLQDKTGNPLAFEDFVEEIIQEIPIAKSKPVRVVRPEVPPHLKKYIIPKKDLPVKTYNPDKKCTFLETREIALPIASLSSEEINIPIPSILNTNFSTEFSDERHQFLDSPKSLPRIFDPLPKNTPVGNADQHAMYHWNQYVDIFRVLVTPTNEWGVKNGCNEIVGFIDTKTLTEKIGFIPDGWGALTSWIRFSPNITEEDIFLNNELWWGFHGSIVYDRKVPPGQYVGIISHFMTHELGHALGLEHDFKQLAQMNYIRNSSPPHNRYQVDTIFSDDAKGARELYKNKTLYPGAIQQITDGSIRLFYHIAEMIVGDMGVIPPENSMLLIDRFTLENVGTVDIPTPKVEWYLTQYVFEPNASKDSLGTTTHLPIPTGTSRTEFNSITLTIPWQVKPGVYYLAARIKVPGDQVPENDWSWLPLQEIHVLEKPEPEPEPPL